jgi:hypothetical protein
VESEEGPLTTVGSQITFKTTRSAPAIDAESTGAVTPFEATVETAVNPEREDTNCSVEYGTTKAYGSVVACEPSDLGGGFGDQAAVAHLTGLQAGQGYCYRVVAQNATGTSKGVGGELTTLAALAPVVESESVLALTSDEAIVEAQMDPGYQETTYHFEYATNSELEGAASIGEAVIVAGAPGQTTGPVVLSDTLMPGQSYFYRVVATNATGTTDGPIRELTTVGLPLVETGPAQGAGRTSAALSGVINPEGAETSYRFLYIVQAGYEAAVGKPNPYANGGSTTEFTLPAGREEDEVGPVSVEGLLAGATYHYALLATNEAGATIGPDRTFTTASATPPIVATGSASQVTQTGAQLAGTVDTRGLQTTYWFETGTEAGHYTLQAPVVIGAGDGGIETVTWQQQYLTPGSAYHYRLCAKNRDGTQCGADQTVATLSYPALVPVEASPYPLLTGAVPVTVTPPKGVGPHTPSRAEKLAKALKSCRAKPRGKRAACERQARRRFGPVGHRKKG